MNNQKKIEDFIDDRLRRSGTSKPSVDFTSSLMLRIQEESRLAKEESKRDTIAKYIISVFCSLVVIGTIAIGILTGSKKSMSISKNFSIEPAIETSNNYFNQFLTLIQNFFSRVLDVFGLTYSPRSFEIILGLLLIISLFMLADRILVKSKLKSR